MSDIQVRPPTVVISGIEYKTQLATIKSTMLGYEDHGILTLFLMCEWPGAGIGVGGYSLDTYDAVRRHRVPTAACGAQIAEVLRIVGVNSWEDLRGQSVQVLFSGDAAVGIADTHFSRYAVWSEFFAGVQP